MSQRKIYFKSQKQVRETKVASSNRFIAALKAIKIDCVRNIFPSLKNRINQ